MKNVVLYTDGACSGNPGPGGWGVVLDYNGIKKQISGYEDNTTNNRMELLAVIKGLIALKETCNVEVYTDSAYVFNAFTQDWIKNWEQNGWVNSSKKQIANIDLWKQLLQLTNIHNVHFNKVKGHSDNELNNLCDKLATSEISKNKDIKD